MKEYVYRIDLISNHIYVVRERTDRIEFFKNNNLQSRYETYINVGNEHYSVGWWLDLNYVTDDYEIKLITEYDLRMDREETINGILGNV